MILAMVAIAIAAAIAGVGDINGSLWNGVATNVIEHSHVG
jgi:pilus assembly protein Flp/PilA